MTTVWAFLILIMIILDSPITMGRRRRPQATHFFIETRGRRPQAAGSRHRNLDHQRIRPQAAGHRTAHLGSGLLNLRQIKKQASQRGCKQEKNLHHHSENGWYAMQSVRVVSRLRYFLLFLIQPIRVRHQCTDNSLASLLKHGSQSVGNGSFSAGTSSKTATVSSLCSMALAFFISPSMNACGYDFRSSARRATMSCLLMLSS